VWSASILVLTVLAVVYTLHLGKEIILPIVLAIVLKLLLQPAMRLLHEGICLPQALSAILLKVFSTHPFEVGVAPAPLP
jgi:predicted PurR-regulated permease PerM